jgi:alpha-tubulin suppressor-like RCC1 family protein
MDALRRLGLKATLLPILLALAGCAPGTASPSAGTLPLLPTWTTRPSMEATSTPAATATSTATASPTPSFTAAFLAAGRRHNCVITTRGGVKCWGENEDGQLGDGTNTSTSTAVDVSELPGVISVDAGYNHTCALTSAGLVYCWGNNAEGQLGDATQTSRNKPVPVSLTGDMLAISTGTQHSCAASARAVYCWGIVDYRMLEGEDVFYFTLKPYPLDLSNLENGERIVGLDSGSDFDCLLTDAGTVYCWGRNDQGQLGQGGTSYSSIVPLPVRGFAGRAEQLSVGGSHACVILSEGSVQCWGYNNAGQLGMEMPHVATEPVTVPGIQDATSVSAGSYHTCAAVSGNRVFCWGDSRFGQLGGDRTLGGGPLNEVAQAAGPVRQVAAGASHSCALRADGTVVCWGNNKSGQLGEQPPAPVPTLSPTNPGPIPTDKKTATPSPTPERLNAATAVAAGRSHTCAVTAAGGVKCWGINEHGQLGNGSWSDSAFPVEVAGLRDRAVDVVAGWGHTCALTTAGGVYCWGYDKNGELGDGGNADRNTPVSVRGLERGVVALEAGDDHTCAVLADNTVRCWGFNEYGQLGDGTGENRNIPVPVAGLTNGAVAVAAGWGHTCALTPEGGVRCWGNNHYGQVGDGSEVENQRRPMWVAGLTGGVKAITADGGQTCALTDRGLVMCWGNNKYGQLGDGTAEDRKLPVAVAGLNFHPAAIVAGWNHTCAVKETGDLACWGWNFFGQLGNGIRTSSTRPVESGELLYGVTDLAAGWGYTCVVTEVGGVQCFGLNDFGQLGDGTIENAELPVDVFGLTGS